MTAPPGMALPLKLRAQTNESIIPALWSPGLGRPGILVQVNDLPPADASAFLQGAHPQPPELLNLQAVQRPLAVFHSLWMSNL